MTEATPETPGGAGPRVGYAGPRGRLAKVAVLALVVAVIGLAYAKFGEALNLESLAKQENAFRQYQQDHPVLVFGVAFLVYVAVTGLSLPGATGMTLILGWFFGFWTALAIVSFASTAGATVAFTVSRYLLRDAIQARFGHRLRSFNQALEKEGAFYLFTLRLIPVVPFFVINLVMGLTPIKTRTFWWVSQIGMLAGTAVYVYAGASVPSLQTLADKGAAGILSPQLIIAFVLLGLFPITTKRILARFHGPAQRENRI